MLDELRELVEEVRRDCLTKISSEADDILHEMLERHAEEWVDYQTVRAVYLWAAKRVARHRKLPDAFYDWARANEGS
jgi:hypothetical protein